MCNGIIYPFCAVQFWLNKMLYSIQAWLLLLFSSVWLEYHCAYFHFQPLYVFASGVSFPRIEKKRILLLISSAGVCLEEFRQPCFCFLGEGAPTVPSSSRLETCWSAELILFLPYISFVYPFPSEIHRVLSCQACAYLSPSSPCCSPRVSSAPLASWAWIALVCAYRGRSWFVLPL